jgi:hypothetical protein
MSLEMGTKTNISYLLLCGHKIISIGILCSYTVEASMAGPEHGSLYRPSDLIIIGEEMCHRYDIF